jgi:ubiquinone/menaquinone biosynthesis C-methylase UbiE
MKWPENSLWRKRRNKLLSSIALPEEGIVLDLSCGDGQFIELIHKIKPNLKLYGIDISEEVIKKASEEYPWATFSVSSSTQTNLHDKKFDIIFCNMAFHHYDAAIKTFIECNEKLAHNGKLYILDLFPKNRASQLVYNWRGCNDDYHFEKYYTFSEIKKLAKQAKLNLISQKVLTRIPRLGLAEFAL